MCLIIEKTENTVNSIIDSILPSTHRHTIVELHWKMVRWICVSLVKIVKYIVALNPHFMTNKDNDMGVFRLSVLIVFFFFAITFTMWYCYNFSCFWRYMYFNFKLWCFIIAQSLLFFKQEVGTKDQNRGLICKIIFNCFFLT